MPHRTVAADLRIVGNVPGWGVFGEATNFNRERMAGYLGMPGAQDVSELRAFPPNTSSISSALIPLITLSPMGFLAGQPANSDGLVRIERATTRIPQVI
jgi:hypothetical protein